MIKKIKNWFFDRFLPMWAKEMVLADNRKLQAENERLLLLLAEKDAYIEGLQAGMRSVRKLVINTGEVKK
jgi:hypothetical protein